jgi:hypothetical protein
MWHKSNIFPFFLFSTLLASLLWVVVLNYNRGPCTDIRKSANGGCLGFIWSFPSSKDMMGCKKVQIQQIARIVGPSLPVTCRSDWGLGGPGKTETPFVRASILLRFVCFVRTGKCHNPAQNLDTTTPNEWPFSTFRSELKLSTPAHCACFSVFSQFLKPTEQKGIWM